MDAAVLEYVQDGELRELVYLHNVEKRFRQPSREEEAHGVQDYVFGGWA